MKRRILISLCLLVLIAGSMRASPLRPVSFLPPEAATQDRQKVLSNTEYEKLKYKVLSRCHLNSSTRPVDAPWYFHYEMGLELVKGGDPQRALDAFLEAVARRRDSKRRARIYGMWLEDYVPYFEIARAQAALGNWVCVASALDLSLERGEVLVYDKEYMEYQELREEVSLHVK